MFSVDPNVAYPIATVILITLLLLGSLKWFATFADLAALRAEIAQKYVLKEDVDRKMDEIKKDVRDGFKEIKEDLIRIYDKIETIIKGR